MKYARDVGMDDEVTELRARYGEPLALATALPDTHVYAATGERRAEVCMVIRRPSGKLIAMTKPFYAGRVYRFPTGGIERNESVEEALRREVAEETGLTTEVSRFLGHIEYFKPAGRRVFETYVFLLDELGGRLGSRDWFEVMSFKDVELSELPAMAASLEGLPELPSREFGDTWKAWGEFRAIAVRTIHQALTG